MVINSDINNGYNKLQTSMGNRFHHKTHLNLRIKLIIQKTNNKINREMIKRYKNKN